MGEGFEVPSGPCLMLGNWRLSVLVLHETLLVPVIMYDSETMLWKRRDLGIGQCR